MAKTNIFANNKLPIWNYWLIMFFRILVGAVFSFSGFVKAVDPWGTIYKVNDYLVAMNIVLPDSIVLFSVIALIVVEFLIGVSILLGCYRRVIPITSFIIMIFMTVFTLWIAVKNPVDDCGCFGDAIKLSNWQTFWKNVVLMGLTAWLVIYARRSRCFVIPTLQWLATTFSVAYVLIIAIYGYIYQPLLDFRPYPVGEKLVSDAIETDEINYRFIYSRDGIEQEFSADSIPQTDDWVFVDRVEISTKVFDENKQIRVYDEYDEDITEDVLLNEGKRIILFYSSLKDVSIASTYQINSLYAYCQNNDIDMVAVASATKEEIVEWRDLSMADYEIYTSEDTSIKEVIRGNPAIAYMEDGVVMFKSSLKAIDIDDFLSPTTSLNPMNFARDNMNILVLVSSIWGLMMLYVVMLSHVPMMIRFLRRRIRVYLSENKTEIK